MREKEGIKLVQIIQIGRRTAMLRLDRERKTTKQNARLRTIPGTKNFHQKLDHFYSLHPEEACLRTRDVVFECVCVCVGMEKRLPVLFTGERRKKRQNVLRSSSRAFFFVIWSFILAFIVPVCY